MRRAATTIPPSTAGASGILAVRATATPTEVIATPSEVPAARATLIIPPVVAAAVGGLPVAVADARTLVDGHDPARWADALSAVLDAGPAEAEALSRAARTHAQRFSWDNTVDALLASYSRAIAGGVRA